MVETKTKKLLANFETREIPKKNDVPVEEVEVERERQSSSNIGKLLGGVAVGAGGTALGLNALKGNKNNQKQNQKIYADGTTNVNSTPRKSASDVNRTFKVEGKTTSQQSPSSTQQINEENRPTVERARERLLKNQKQTTTLSSTGATPPEKSLPEKNQTTQNLPQGNSPTKKLEIPVADEGKRPIGVVAEGEGENLKTTRSIAQQTPNSQLIQVQKDFSNEKQKTNKLLGFLQQLTNRRFNDNQNNIANFEDEGNGTGAFLTGAGLGAAALGTAALLKRNPKALETFKNQKNKGNTTSIPNPNAPQLPGSSNTEQIGTSTNLNPGEQAPDAKLTNKRAEEIDESKKTRGVAAEINEGGKQYQDLTDVETKNTKEGVPEFREKSNISGQKTRNVVSDKSALDVRKSQNNLEQFGINKNSEEKLREGKEKAKDKLNEFVASTGITPKQGSLIQAGGAIATRTAIGSE